MSAVAEQFLHGAQVPGRLQQVGGEGVPQQVGVDAAGSPLLLGPALQALLARCADGCAGRGC